MKHIAFDLNFGQRLINVICYSATNLIEFKMRPDFNAHHLVHKSKNAPTKS
jgi:hypothetical protein